MIPISIKEYAKLHVKSNPTDDDNAVELALRDAVRRKENGAVCYQCGQPIWALGSAIAEMNMCFACITGETDDADDYEVY